MTQSIDDMIVAAQSEISHDVQQTIWDLEEWVADKFLSMGMKPGLSSDYGGDITAGFGRLDYGGNFEFPIRHVEKCIPLSRSAFSNEVKIW